MLKYLMAGMIAMSTGAQAAQVKNLRCEYQNNPVGIDAATPRLSWSIESGRRGDRQTAYQALAASTPERLAADEGDLWNSGKVASGQSAYVVYAGSKMRSRLRCFWKVRVWDKDGKVSPWSPSASWTMGLLKPSDWTARWISASRWFMPPDVRPPGFIAGSGGWADVDLGAVTPIESIRLYPLAAASFPVRFKIEGADEPQFLHPEILVDRSDRDYPTTGADAQEFPVAGKKKRYVRLTVVRAPDPKAAVRQMEVMSGGRNVALMKFTREFGTDWDHGHAAFLVDGLPSHDEGDACPPDACPTTAAPLLRKSFTPRAKVKRATLYAASLGMADLTLNGVKVGDAVLGPPFSDYSKRVFYVTHDITPLLTAGENVLGAILGNGFYSPPKRGFGERNGGDGPPRLLVQAEIEYADGSHETIGTDESWRWSRGAIAYNDLWDGYSEDRHLDKPGWDRPGYAASDDWRTAGLAEAPSGKLCAPMGPAIRVLGQLHPTRVENNHVYFDSLSSGWPRLTLKHGKAGQTITLHGSGPGFELPALSFTLASDGPAVLEPNFIILSGPIDLRVDGLTEPLTADMARIDLVGADLKSTGAFTCSNAYLNTLHDATLRTHRNYIFDVPADPTREKQGWTQDAQNMFDTSAYFTDVSGMYRRWWWDMADNQEENGYTGSIVPLMNRHGLDWNSPWWSGVIVLLPWKHYLYYGDRRVLEDAYEPMRRYVDFLGKMADAGVGKAWGDYPYLNVNQDLNAAKERMIQWNGAGDWHNPTTGGQFVVPAPMTTMPAWHYYATIVSKTASMLGKSADAAKYAAVAKDVQDRLNAKYFHPETGLYGTERDNETAQVLPLAVGLTPDDRRGLAYQRLIDAIHARQDHIACGFVALPLLLQLLTETRETALVNKMVNQKDYPSWATLMHDGILGEDWHGGGAQMPSTGGSIGMWLYQSVLGIRPDPAGPGFAKFILAPQPDAATGLTSAKGYYDSVHGKIVSEWSWKSGRFTLHAVIPVNTSATVYIPTQNEKTVMESGKPAAGAADLKFLRREGGAAVYEVGSGAYDFTAGLSE